MECIKHIELTEKSSLYHGILPDHLKVKGKKYYRLWYSHPDEFSKMYIYNKDVDLPR